MRSLGSSKHGKFSFSQPWGVAFDSVRNLFFVCDRGRSQIRCFLVNHDSADCSKGAFLELWQFGPGNSRAGQIPVSLNMPRGCALSADMQTLAVVDAENHQIVLLRSSDGVFLSAFSADDAGTSPMRLPSCVCVFVYLHAVTCYVLCYM